MIRVGVTGGIGSGKTTLCKMWEDKGVYVLYMDDFAKHIMVSDPELVSSIKNVFGSQAYFEDGKLNREYLAHEAFHKGRVEELNAIVHPALWKASDKVADQKEEEGAKVFVKEAAILLKHGRPKNLDYVVLVLSDKERRIERTLKRDQTTEEKVQDRLNKQPDFENYQDLADFIVMNNGSVSELESEAERVLDLLK
ncbi:MAG: dephospho-CoA kinase [Balneola sp.]|nr:MAG: dephospho-CoA kinase [Balneola sp.]